jgi:phage terminase large subunit-like protein
VTTIDLGDKAVLQFERLCPQTLGNPYMGPLSLPHPKQRKLLGAHIGCEKPVFEILFGGAAGGGKSYGLLIAAAQYAWHYPQFRAVLLRRSRTEAKLPGNLIDKAKRLWLPAGVKWLGDDSAFEFPSGARVVMGYHDGTTRDDLQFYGSDWHLIGFDELTHWPLESTYELLRSRCRKNIDDPIPLRMIATSNPGGPGHDWVKRRFMGGVDPATQQVVAAVGSYIPSRIDDNPSLDREPYKETLRDMHPTRRRQLLDGDWSARDPGDYFRVEWFGPMLDPAEVVLPTSETVRVRWWDLAASEKQDAARTAGVLMARVRAGCRFVEHATAFKATPGKRDDKIVQQAHIDGRHVVVGIEIEGGSGGIAQFDALQTRLKAEGFRVVGARPQEARQLTWKENSAMARNSVGLDAKQRRADPVASCLERGYQRRGECSNTGGKWWGADKDLPPLTQRDGLRLFAGPWTQGYVDELEGFPEAALCDQVDATSGAWAWLEAHAFGRREPPAPAQARQKPDGPDTHPDDRPAGGDAMAGDRDAAGRWRP